jgi:DNA-binding protein YbaB
MFDNADESTAYVESLVTQARVNAQKAQEMAERMDALRVPGSSPNGLVSVVLGQSGNLLDVRFEESALRGDTARLRDDVMGAVAQAQGRLTTQVTELAREHYGDASATAAEFSGRYADRFGSEDLA